MTQVDKRFSEVISLTTRPSRGKNDVYRFVDDDTQSIDNLIAQAKRGNLVNFAVHPTTGYVYGTESDDYRTDFCMLATTANNCQLATSKLPFRTVNPVVVVSDPEVWAGRISQRAMSLTDYKSRLSEAKKSLEWSLDHNDVALVDNTHPNINGTAIRFTHNGIANQTPEAHPSRQIAEKMLAYINKL